MKKYYLLLSFLLFLPSMAMAANGQMFFNSGAGVYQVGRTFTPGLIVNTDGAKINTVGAALKFDPKYLKVNKITKDGSICQIWAIEPVFDNKAGKIILGCGTPKEFKGSAGIIANINFTVLKAGKSYLEFTTDKTLATSTILTDEEYPINILTDPRPAIYTGASLAAVNSAKAMIARLSGRILLQVQKNGEAWYIYPKDLKRYYLGRPADAFAIMRKLGLGATHKYVTAYLNKTFPKAVAGKILLDVEDLGKAYYIYPMDRKAYYLGRPADAFAIMRKLGLGATNDTVDQIPDWGI
jgi:ribosomal protein L30/L7E